MFDRETKEELAILLPNTMPEYLHHEPAPAPAAKRSAALVHLVAVVRWVNELLRPSAVIWTR